MRAHMRKHTLIASLLCNDAERSKSTGIFCVRVRSIIQSRNTGRRLAVVSDFEIGSITAGRYAECIHKSIQLCQVGTGTIA